MKAHRRGADVKAHRGGADVRAHRRDEAGFAVPVVIGLGGVLVALALAGTAGGQVLVAQRRAGAAADLSALAGAVAAQHGQDPCAAAGRVAVLDHARMARCEVDDAGDTVRVVAEVSLTLAGHDLRVRARAHAGPRTAG